MHIALDVSNAARPQPTGVAMYIRHLAAALAEAGRDHRFTLVNRLSRWKHRRHFVQPSADNVTSKIIQEPFHPYFGKSVDIFHGLDARIPGPWMQAKLVVTIHDIFSAMQSKEFATEAFRKLKAKRYRDIIDRAHRIITVSEACKRDVIETLEVEPERVEAIHEAASERFYPREASAIQPVREKYGLNRPYFVYIGSLNKRKNIPNMITAFLQAREKTKSDALFALSGRIGFGGEQIKETIEKGRGQDCIKWLGYVPDEDVPILYSGAEALLFTTLYEGFGIPVVEAFNCGCPVIGGNKGSVPEIIGKSGLLADPEDTEEIADRIERLLTDSELRSELKLKGQRRAKDFSWKKSAEAYMQVYKNLMLE